MTRHFFGMALVTLSLFTLASCSGPGEKAGSEGKAGPAVSGAPKAAAPAAKAPAAEPKPAVEDEKTKSCLSLVAAAQFAEVGTTAVLLTKLDEATGLGNLLPLLRSCKLPLSYVTDGQNVPDDIQVADQHRLARIVLGMK